MNATIHPATYETLVHCATCGTEHDLRSTREHLSVEVCSSCHPVYTGVDQRVTRGGQIARFVARRQRATAAQS